MDPNDSKPPNKQLDQLRKQERFNGDQVKLFKRALLSLCEVKVVNGTCPTNLYKPGDLRLTGTKEKPSVLIWPDMSDVMLPALLNGAVRISLSFVKLQIVNNITIKGTTALIMHNCSVGSFAKGWLDVMLPAQKMASIVALDRTTLELKSNNFTNTEATLRSSHSLSKGLISNVKIADNTGLRVSNVTVRDGAIYELSEVSIAPGLISVSGRSVSGRSSRLNIIRCSSAVKRSATPVTVDSGATLVIASKQLTIGQVQVLKAASARITGVLTNNVTVSGKETLWLGPGSGSILYMDVNSGGTLRMSSPKASLTKRVKVTNAAVPYLKCRLNGNIVMVGVKSLMAINGSTGFISSLASLAHSHTRKLGAPLSALSQSRTAATRVL